MALARIERLTFAYPGAPEPALADVSLTLEPGEVVAVLGPSGSGKSTLLRALAGLVPHFHGGRFRGRVEVAGRDTRTHRPAELAGDVAVLFQDPEDQVVFSTVATEVAFGLENLGAAPASIVARADRALREVGAAALAERRVETLSAGELQRVCLAAALAVEPRLLLLDEPTSQLDPDFGGLELAASLARERGTTVVASEQRPDRILEHCDRVLFVEDGRVCLDAPLPEALDWLAEHRPAYVPREPLLPVEREGAADPICQLDGISYSYGAAAPVLDGIDLELHRGEIAALTGRNGSGKTTLAKVVAGLVLPDRGRVWRRGRAAYLSQHPGRYVVRSRVDEEVALGVAGDLGRARRALAAVGLAGFDDRHPRDLSSGERERVALASVLVTDPDVLVLDEPTRGLDPEHKDDLADLLRAGRHARATLVVTHDLVFAGDVADRQISLTPRSEVVHA